MNYLSVENLSKSFGVRTLFSNITFGIDQGEKVAFVAKNGSGKSTLMRILSGQDTPDGGNVVFRGGIKVGFLPQQPIFPVDKTVEDIIYSADTPELRAIARYERAAHDPQWAADFQAAYEQMDSLQVWDYELRIQNILSQLQLDTLKVPCGEMSGGQVRRLALAQVLIEKPDFLILDEPTNHLDLPMVEWLENYLSGEKITLFMVTHDRYFLDRVCTDILELDGATLWRYKGTYSYFLEKRAERYSTADAETAKAQNTMRKELEWIRRQPQARGTKAKARIDAFDDLKKRAAQRIEERVMTLGINMERLGSKVVELHLVSKTWGDLKVLDRFEYTFRRGERLGIVGNNGTGKSSFVRLITGDTQPDAGRVVVGDTVVFGYYRQEGIQINPGEKVIEVIKKYGDYLPMAKGRKLSAEQLLERFLFSRSQQWDYVEKLSGGELRRLYLCTVLIANPNFLILDEPTNDLDIITLTILEEFLAEYPGVLLIVSHDRYFMDKIVDHILVFSGNGEVKEFPGTYSEYRQWQKNSPKEEVKEDVADVEKTKTERVKTTKNRLSFKEQREYESIEQQMPLLTSEKKSIEDTFASGEILSTERVNELSERMKEIISTLDTLEERWLELSMKLEEE
ncbi:MAG: ABC-F family ATP-binding cassette domain-containing protein [Flavobacteriales bacterium]|nr:ABC-F family ATP-binding cassette domain-containing protein [Flavobacteriales bacterium]